MTGRVTLLLKRGRGGGGAGENRKGREEMELAEQALKRAGGEGNNRGKKKLGGVPKKVRVLIFKPDGWGRR